MSVRTLWGALTVLGIVGAAATAQATIIMDASTHNGSLSGATNGNWSNAASVPAGWAGSPPNLAYTQSGGGQHYYSAQTWNNTGVVVTANTIYAVTAKVNSRNTQPTTTDLAVIIQVRATENSDGTGDWAILAEATLAQGSGATGWPTYTSLPPLIDIADSGAATNSALAGYFVQVRTLSDQATIGYYWVDDMVVTSEVPEPATLGLLCSSIVLLGGRIRRCS